MRIGLYLKRCPQRSAAEKASKPLPPSLLQLKLESSPTRREREKVNGLFLLVPGRRGSSLEPITGAGLRFKCSPTIE